MLCQSNSRKIHSDKESPKQKMVLYCALVKFTGGKSIRGTFLSDNMDKKHNPPLGLSVSKHKSSYIDTAQWLWKITSGFESKTEAEILGA